MTGFGSLLARELRRRLPLHALSLVLGLLVVALPALQSSASTVRLAEIRGAVGVGVAALWGLAIALAEGLGFLATDLRERRLGFDFRLPVAASAIWASRSLAALLSVASAVAFVLGPLRLVGADLHGGAAGAEILLVQGTGIALTRPLLAVALVLLILLLSGGWFGLALASRSRWTGLDLAVVILFKGLAILAFFSLWRASAEAEAGATLVVAVAAATVALAAASWRQLVAGRTEPDRAHRAFSLAFATVALVVVIPLFLWSRWLLHPAFDDLVAGGVVARPLSRGLVTVAGQARHRPAGLRFGFVVAPATRRSAPLGFARSGGGIAQSSLDGATIAWLEVERVDALTWSSRLRYASPEAVLRGAGREGPSWTGIPFSWTLSPDGIRVASAWRGPNREPALRIQVEGLADGNLVGTAPLLKCGAPGPMLFIADNRLRYACGTHYPAPWNDLVSAYMLEIDLDSGAVDYPGETPYTDRPLDSRFARSVQGLFEPATQRHRRRDPGQDLNRLAIVGRPVRTLEPPPELPGGATVGSARFFSDGRLAVVWRAVRRSLVMTYDSRGTELSRYQLDSPYVEIAAELDGGTALLLATSYGARDRQRTLTRLSRLPLDGGALAEIAKDLRPWRPESVAIPTTLFSDESGRLLWLDLDRLELVPLLD